MGDFYESIDLPEEGKVDEGNLETRWGVAQVVFLRLRDKRVLGKGYFGDIAL